MAKKVVLVAAYARNRAIGKDGDMPWHLPHDFAHFKRVTMGGTLLMGRATWDSIGRPLPGRESVVVTRNPEWTAGQYADQVLVAHTLEEGLGVAASRTGDVMVVGGGQIYAAAMPYASHQVLTEVDLEVEDADAFYPEFDPEQWVETRRETGDSVEWVWWQRR